MCGVDLTFRYNLIPVASYVIIYHFIFVLLCNIKLIIVIICGVGRGGVGKRTNTICPKRATNRREMKKRPASAYK